MTIKPAMPLPQSNDPQLAHNIATVVRTLRVSLKAETERLHPGDADRLAPVFTYCVGTLIAEQHGDRPDQYAYLQEALKAARSILCSLPSSSPTH